MVLTAPARRFARLQLTRLVLYMPPSPRQVSRLSAYATPDGKRNRMGIGVHSSDVSSQQDYNKLMDDSDVIIHDIVRKAHTDPVTTAYVRAGPRATLHFDPSKVSGWLG
jgi:hypothetical protein